MGHYLYAVSFRVHHPNADLSFVGDRLGWPVFRVWKVGEPRTSRGRPLPGIYKTSYCTLRLAEAHEREKRLPDLIAESLDRLEKHKAMLDELAASGGTFEFFIGWWLAGNSGDGFDWRLMKRLADLKVSLDFDVYAEQEED